jgi:predicted dehydrogenase
MTEAPLGDGPRTLGWGVLGTGWIADLQARDLLRDGARVAAVGSRTADRARAFADQLGIARAHGSYTALVGDPDVDVVYIATPASAHAADARLALEAGKHVLLEKPFTLSAAQAEPLVELARARGLVLMEAMWTRFLPHMTRIRSLLADGAIGTPRTLIADVGQRAPLDSRLHRRDLAGGALLDIGVYPVSFALELFGEPETVRSVSVLSAAGVDLQTSVALGFAGGAQALGHAAIDVQGPNRATILGTAGRIEIDRTWYGRADFSLLDGDGAEVERFVNPAEPRGMQFQARELERLVLDGRRESAIMPLGDTLAVLRVLDRIRAEQGIVFDVDAAAAAPEGAPGPGPALGTAPAQEGAAA